LSQQLFNQLKHLHEEVKYLKEAMSELHDRLIALEAEKTEGTELDLDTLQPKRRGRPPKVKNEQH
jgi:hypothetical protein